MAEQTSGPLRIPFEWTAELSLSRASASRKPDADFYHERVKPLLSRDRYQHTLRVMQLARQIGRANDFTQRQLQQTELAAILHDAAREFTADELFCLAPPACELERNHPLTVHGRAARKLAARWGITDETVLDAISGHVLGVSHNDPVGMAVYVADVSEPGRLCNDAIRELALTDLQRAYVAAVRSKVDYLTAKGKPVHPTTLAVHEAIGITP